MRIFLLVAASLQTILASDDTKQLRSLLEAALDKHVPAIPHIPQQQQHPHHQGHHRTREGRQIQSADPGAIMYLNIGGGGNVRLTLILSNLVLHFILIHMFKM